MTSKRPGKSVRVSEPATSHEKASRARRQAVKRARNLSLTGEAVARGEGYARSRGTTLSALVEQFLRGLPEPVEVGDDTLDPAERRLREISAVRATTRSPLVRELYGLLAGSDPGNDEPRELYREHLWRRHRGST